MNKQVDMKRGQELGVFCVVGTLEISNISRKSYIFFISKMFVEEMLPL